jgi:hypothetical protein
MRAPADRHLPPLRGMRADATSSRRVQDIRRTLNKLPPMNTAPLTETLPLLLSELVDGASGEGGFMLNGGDPGLLASLDRLDAEAASAEPPGGASVAAHVDHVVYALSLMNRWAEREENPFAGSDWAASWRRGTVGAAEWERLRAELRDQAHRWREALRTPREVQPIELAGMIGSIAHLAYHVGAIRQIDRAARGPGAEERAAAGA